MRAILDIDGTLVDSNYQHALSWFRAARDHGYVLPLSRIHRAIGLGGDLMVAHLIDEEAEERSGEAIRASEAEHYFSVIDEVQPLDGARDLVLALKRADHAVVMASSAKPEEVDHYLTLLGARGLVDSWTTAGDVENTKPAPDLVQTAMAKAEGEQDAILIGDSVWDVEAAKRAGIPTLAVLTGGYSEAELLEAGAQAVFSSVRELLEQLGETPLGTPGT
ncbi:MAG: HAD family hydrolase [Actinobacteria bacterium]|nr:HAD family hydrolase [Actinomycetota bacterium]